MTASPDDPTPPVGAMREAIEQPGKLLRIGTMVREMLEEVRRAPLDEQGRQMLRRIYDQSVAELSEVLSPDLLEELNNVHAPFGPGTPTEAELRIAQAQLVGWLEGLFHGIQAALWAQQVAAQNQMSQFPRRALDAPKREGGTGHYL